VTDLLFYIVLSAAWAGIITQLKWAQPAFELAGRGGVP
jgi:hypothetical protein